MSVFIDQSYLTLVATTNIDMSAATVTKILYVKPDKTSTGSWDAIVRNKSLVYNIQDGDIDQSGMWQFQAYVEIDGKKGFGHIEQIKFNEHLTVV